MGFLVFILIGIAVSGLMVFVFLDSRKPTETTKKIDSNLKNLLQVLKSRKYRFKSAIWVSLPKFSESNLTILQDFVSQIKDYCELKGCSIGVGCDPLKISSDLLDIGNDKVDVPGHMIQLNANQFYIYVSKRYLDDSKVVVSILAHEMAHVYAFYNDIKFRSKDGGQDYLASEQMTDLLAVSLGMGKLLCSGQVYYKELKNSALRCELGYLSVDTARYAYKSWKKLVKELKL